MGVRIRIHGGYKVTASSDTVFNRETRVIVDTGSEDSGIVSAAVSGVIDPGDTFGVAYDQILEVMVIGIDSMNGESKEIAVDASAFFILAAALAGEDITEGNEELD